MGEFTTHPFEVRARGRVAEGVTLHPSRWQTRVPPASARGSATLGSTADAPPAACWVEAAE